MQDEGTTSTSTSEVEMQGDLEVTTTTTTTTVIENKNTGAILSSESTGIVAERYEGDMDQDWGGQGSINSHTSCNNKLGVYTGSNTCASARLDSLTTWRQTVDLNQFSIDDGGQVRWEMRFGMEPGMYNDASKTAFVELKGYEGTALQWTDTYNVDKSTFTLNANGNYLAPYGHINSNVDYSGGLSSLYINIGGYGEYMFDSVWFDVYYNQITTTVSEEIVYNLIQNEIIETINTVISDTSYTTPDPVDDPIGDPVDDMPVFPTDDFGPVVTLPTISLDDVAMPIEIQTIDDAGFTPTLNVGEPVVTVETITEEIQEVMTVEVAQPEPEPIKVESQPEPEIAVNTPEEPVNEDLEQPINAPTEPVEEVEDSKPTPETASNDEPVEEIKEEPKEVVEEQSEPEPQEKEVAKNEPKEEPEEAKEEPKQEEVKEAKVEDKSTKKQEAKQEKAKQIMQSFDSQYDAVAQLTTLALVNALGADIKTYQQIPTQVQPTWYESKDIYANSMLQDPLGNYFGVRDSLTFNKLVDMQYE
tara:strand:+ start:534 stop:2123 length:1590 start_codon:yes stop_codon:yes gene_type:complete